MVLGVHNLGVADDKTLVKKANRIIYPKSFDPITFKYDIALIQLKDYIEVNPID